MTRAAAALAEARRWIGTPYRHRASCRGAGCDCLGLLRGIWRALYGCEPGPLPVYSGDWAEAGGRERLWCGLAARMAERPAGAVAAPGDVILLRMKAGAMAKHLGIQADVGPAASFIHAYWGHGVVESPLTGPWARRVVARFEFPDGSA